MAISYCSPWTGSAPFVAEGRRHRDADRVGCRDRARAALTLRAFPGRDVLDALVTAPLVVPPTVLGYYLLVLLGRPSALGRTFEAMTGSPIVFTQVGATVAAAVGALPFVVRSARAALESVDSRLVLAARTLGAGRGGR